MRLSPDQLDDILSRLGLSIDGETDTDLDPRLVFLSDLNDELTKVGAAGTHAYDMMAAVEEINTGTTRYLIELIAAVVMVKRNENALLDTMSVTFAPSDIDDMQRDYDMAVKRDGLHVTVTLTKKTERTESWQLPDEEGGEGAREQAEKPPERPVWAVRTADGKLVGVESREDAERQLSGSGAPLDSAAHIENRYCFHEDCPSTGCNHAEATSNT